MKWKVKLVCPSDTQNDEVTVVMEMHGEYLPVCNCAWKIAKRLGLVFDYDLDEIEEPKP